MLILDLKNKASKLEQDDLKGKKKNWLTFGLTGFIDDDIKDDLGGGNASGTVATVRTIPRRLAIPS